jgi:hypothetical protein
MSKHSKDHSQAQNKHYFKENFGKTKCLGTLTYNDFHESPWDNCVSNQLTIWGIGSKACVSWWTCLLYHFEIWCLAI